MSRMCLFFVVLDVRKPPTQCASLTLWKKKVYFDLEVKRFPCSAVFMAWLATLLKSTTIEYMQQAISSTPYPGQAAGAIEEAGCFLVGVWVAE